MVIEKFASCRTQYRFNKKSNFVTYEQFCEDEAIDKLIRLGEELKRYKNFKNKTDEELAKMVINWQKQENVHMPNELFAKYQGIDARYELERRNKLQVIAEMRKHA